MADDAPAPRIIVALDPRLANARVTDCIGRDSADVDAPDLFDDSDYSSH